jgi:hypothetical protein
LLKLLKCYPEAVPLNKEFNTSTMETVKTRILLVEDDPSLGPLLQEYLEAKGFETKLADDGKKGGDLFFKGEFDLLLLDVMMPVKTA